MPYTIFLFGYLVFALLILKLYFLPLFELERMDATKTHRLIKIVFGARLIWQYAIIRYDLFNPQICQGVFGTNHDGNFVAIVHFLKWLDLVAETYGDACEDIEIYWWRGDLLVLESISVQMLGNVLHGFFYLVDRQVVLVVVNFDNAIASAFASL